MRQRLTDVASACFRYSSGQPYRFGIGVSNICIGEPGIRQAYQQAREMMKLSFYEEEGILYFDCDKKITGELPAAAERLYENIGLFKRERKQEELSGAWDQVIAAARKSHTDGKVLIQWLRRLDKEAGIERAAEFYDRIRTMGQLAAIGKSYASKLFEDKKPAAGGLGCSPFDDGSYHSPSDSRT